MPACITTVSGEGGAAKSLPKVVEARLPLRSQIPSTLFEALDRIVRSTERHKLHHLLIAAGSEIEEDSAPHAVAAAAGLAESIGAKGDLAVVVAGIPIGQSGSTNNLRVIRIGGEGRSPGQRGIATCDCGSR